MSALEEVAALAGRVAERGESWLWFGLAPVGFGVASLGPLFVRQAAACVARSSMVSSQGRRSGRTTW